MYAGQIGQYKGVSPTILGFTRDRCGHWDKAKCLSCKDLEPCGKACALIDGAFCIKFCGVVCAPYDMGTHTYCGQRVGEGPVRILTGTDNDRIGRDQARGAI